MSFRPSTHLPPIIYNQNQDVHHAQGGDIPRGDPAFTMSRSQLVKFAKCPRKWLKGIPDEMTPAMEFGDLVDCVTLTPSRLKTDYAIAPTSYTDVPERYVLTSEFDGEWNPRTAVCRAWKAEQDAKGFEVLTPGQLAECETPKPWNWNAGFCYRWREEALKSGKTIVKGETLSNAWKAHRRLREDEEIAVILDSCRTQVQINVEWVDRSTGIVVPVKCLLDLVPDPQSPVGDTDWDLKTTNDAEPDAWARRVFNDNLDWQAAMYLDAHRCVEGKGYKRFGHVIVESEEPYEPVHRIMSEEFVDRGRDKYRAAMARYCQCLKTGIWPGYSTDITEPEAWMLMR